MSAVKYFIDGKDIKGSYGVCVSVSDGIIGRPKLKKIASVDWDNYHGEAVDLKHKFYAPREITLSCFVKADSKSEFIARVMEFEQLFNKPGTQRLLIQAHPTKPLIYEVYCKDEISIIKQWSDNTMVGTFKLKLIEPEPVKRVLEFTRSGANSKKCSITLTTTKLVNIYWGDGELDEDISGNEKTITHDYAKNGIYFPVITGCIDEISLFTSNGTTIWNKL